MGLKYAGFRLAEWLSHRLPPQAAFQCAEWIADFQWRRSAKDREAVETNLALVLGAHPPVGSPLVREVFRNFGRYLVEFFTFHRIQEPVIQLEGCEALHSATQRGRGALVLTGHVGNWEIGAAVLRRLGFAINAVALPHVHAGMDRLFNRQRERCGVTVIPLGTHAARRSLESLRRGQLLGILCDREFADHGITVSFCGRDVTFPRGPAVMSARSQSPAVPTFLIREGRYAFRLYCEAPIWPPKLPISEDGIRTLTQQYAAAFERYVKRFPTQWLMFEPVVR